MFQILFLAIYDLLLSKETFFTKNRWYLLGTSIVSFALPLIKIPTFQKAASQEFLIVLPEIVLSPQKVIEKTIEQAQLETSFNYLSILFWIGVVVFSIVFLLKLITVFRLIIKNEKQKQHNVTLVLLSKTSKAFSFFNYIFIGKAIEKEQKEKIIQHELVHSQQRHTLDLLFFEFLKIVMWFNPMIYLYQKRITLVHEYISDEVISTNETKESYINNLLSSIFDVENIGFVNQFYKQSLIKKRIKMIMKTQSKKINQLKYLLLIPVLGSMLFYVACSEDISNEEILGKQKLTLYKLSKNGLVESEQFEKETYLDAFLGSKIPSNFKEIPVSKLTKEEKNEYLNKVNSFTEFIKTNPNVSKRIERKLLIAPNGRKVIADLFIKSEGSSEIISREEVSFISIDKAPTFDGCETGDKACFSKNIQKHFAMNFDAKMTKNLGLSSGRKRVFIQFNIDKNGNITEIKARAPHQKIENEVIRVMELLPKVEPGEHQGKKVSVKYSIPFTLVIE